MQQALTKDLLEISDTAYIIYLVGLMGISSALNISDIYTHHEDDESLYLDSNTKNSQSSSLY